MTKTEIVTAFESDFPPEDISCLSGVSSTGKLYWFLCAATYIPGFAVCCSRQQNGSIAQLAEHSAHN